MPPAQLGISPPRLDLTANASASQRVDTSVTFYNYGDMPKRIQVELVDVDSDFVPIASSQNTLKAWTFIAPQDFEIKAGGYQTIRLSFRLPDDFAQKSHYAFLNTKQHIDTPKDDYWRYRISQDYPTGRFASTYAYSIDPDKHHLSSSHRLSYHTTLQNHLQMARTKSQDKIPVLLASSVQHRLSDNQSLSLGVSWQNLNNQVGLNGSWQYHTQNGMSLGAGYRHGTVSNGFDGRFGFDNRLNGREMGCKVASGFCVCR